MDKEREGRCYAVIKYERTARKNEEIDSENLRLNANAIKRKDAIFLACRPW